MKRIKLLAQIPVRTPGHEELAQCLAAYGAMECRESLDKVYSLLSLDQSCPIVANHALTVDQLGQGLALYLLRNRLTATVLYNARGMPIAQKVEDDCESNSPPPEWDGPSWAIDLERGLVLVERNLAKEKPSQSVEAVQPEVL